MIAVAITAALLLVALGAWLRARAMTPPPADEPMSDYDDWYEPPHRDDRHGGDW